MKETFRCVSRTYYGRSEWDSDRCRRLNGHSGRHRYHGEVVTPKPSLFPKEPEHGWSPYTHVQDRKEYR